MKKIICLILSSLILSTSFAQSDTGLGAELKNETPVTVSISSDTGNDNSITAEENDFAKYFGSTAMFMVLMALITGYVTKAANMNQSWSQATSWAIAIFLSLIGYWKQVGMFNGIDIINSLSIGIGCAVLTNTAYDTGILDGILKFFFAKKE